MLTSRSGISPKVLFRGSIDYHFTSKFEANIWDISCYADSQACINENFKLKLKFNYAHIIILVLLR